MRIQLITTLEKDGQYITKTVEAVAKSIIATHKLTSSSTLQNILSAVASFATADFEASLQSGSLVQVIIAILTAIIEVLKAL